MAHRFCDYLSTLKIDAVAESMEGSDGAWEVWIRDEESIVTAKDEWLRFQQSPQDARFRVGGEVERERDRRGPARGESQPGGSERGKGQRGGNQQGEPDAAAVDAGASDRTTNGGLPRARQTNIPITIAIIVCSVVASLTSHFGSPRGSRDPGKTTLEQKTYYTLSFVDRRDYETSRDAFGSIRKGEIWRLITPMFLHGDELHLAFNMLWVFFLGSAIERLHGSIFLLVMVLITQSAGMMLQVMLPDASYIPESLRGSPFAIGASGAVYGLFGFLWLRPMIDKSYPVVLVPMNVAMMLGWLVLCLTPMGQNVANGAHLGGLISGMAMALIGPWRRQ